LRHFDRGALHRPRLQRDTLEHLLHTSQPSGGDEGLCTCAADEQAAKACYQGRVQAFVRGVTQEKTATRLDHLFLDHKAHTVQGCANVGQRLRTRFDRGGVGFIQIFPNGFDNDVDQGVHVMLCEKELVLIRKREKIQDFRFGKFGFLQVIHDSLSVPVGDLREQLRCCANDTYTG
jgi:hypothetical protein